MAKRIAYVTGGMGGIGTAIYRLLARQRRSRVRDGSRLLAKRRPVHELAIIGTGNDAGRYAVSCARSTARERPAGPAQKGFSAPDSRRRLSWPPMGALRLCT